MFRSPTPPPDCGSYFHGTAHPLLCTSPFPCDVGTAYVSIPTPPRLSIVVPTSSPQLIHCYARVPSRAMWGSSSCSLALPFFPSFRAALRSFRFRSTNRSPLGPKLEYLTSYLFDLGSIVGGWKPTCDKPVSPHLFMFWKQMRSKKNCCQIVCIAKINIKNWAQRKNNLMTTSYNL